MRNKFSNVPDFNSFFTKCGDRIRIEYESRLRPDGTLTLCESSRSDIQNQINSHAMECDMSVIIHKLQYGDTSVLSSRSVSYGDFTNFPKTYAGILDLVNRSEKAFESLSPDVKAKFNNDRNIWFASIGTPSWLDAMGFSSNARDIPSGKEITNE